MTDQRLVRHMTKESLWLTVQTSVVENSRKLTAFQSWSSTYVEAYLDLLE